MKIGKIGLLAMLAISTQWIQPLAADRHHKHQTSSSSSHSAHDKKVTAKYFKHNIQLQLSDSLGFPVDGTQFWVTLDVIQEGPKVTIKFPCINFQTGQFANSQGEEWLQESLPEETPVPLVPGGYLYTSDGFLPKSIRPNDLVNQSFLVASNNGATQTFSPVLPPPNPPQPVAYTLQLTNFGGIVVQAAGTFGNIIPPGNQVLMPTTLTYIVSPAESLPKNKVLSEKQSNFAIVSNEFFQANDSVRDFHVNDAHDGVVAWTWVDNSMVPDSIKETGTMNIMVAVGKVDHHGKLHMKPPVQLTNFGPYIQGYSSAVTIVRDGPSKGNIVVSYGMIDNNNVITPPCRAVSTDGGKKWPAPYEYTAVVGSITGTTLTVTEVLNGALNIGDTIFGAFILEPGTPVASRTVIAAQTSGTPGGVGTYTVNNAQTIASTNLIASPPLNGPLDILPQYADGFGDVRGVASDKFGNVWYSVTSFFDQDVNTANIPTLSLSVDGGLTFTPVLTDIPSLAPIIYDYPSLCFGGNQGEYGMYYVTDIANLFTLDVEPSILFIPIQGLGNFGPLPSDFLPLPQFNNTNLLSNIAASSSGKLWIQSIQNPFAASYIQPTSTIFKSPGDLTENYAGPWQTLIYNNYGVNYSGLLPVSTSGMTSLPIRGYINNSVQSIVYDEKREALYSMYAFQTPDQSQNMRLAFIISRDNGQTWSNPIDIATSTKANRGFQTMALDNKTGNLLFGWYDGRHDPVAQQKLEYYAAVFPAKKLDKLVSSIPLSNPLYSVPAETLDVQRVPSLPVTKEKLAALEKKLATKFHRKTFAKRNAHKHSAAPKKGNVST